MKVLLIKTSSMGDVVHTLTALRETKTQRPDLIIDWLVEEDFADIASLALQNGDIHSVIPVRFREWRKRKPFGAFFNPDIAALKQSLKHTHYDLVLDAQGLFKSAFLARLSGAPIVGFDRYSAREGIACRCYRHAYPVAKEQHAIERLRLLFAQAFAYTPLPKAPSFPHAVGNQKEVVLLHGTSWDNKRYPTSQWHKLAKALSQQGYHLKIPHHGEAGYRIAEYITDGVKRAEILPEQSIDELRTMLIEASAVISVDTGLAHLAVYLGVPTVMLFGPTRPELTGGLGTHTINLVGKAADTAKMKREVQDEKTFSASMRAIPVSEILSAVNQLLSATTPSRRK